SMGYEFQDSDELALMRQTVRIFAETEIAPRARLLDEKEEFSVALTRQMGELGLFGTIVPTTYGGQGMDYISYVVAVEELARVDG
ncbi:acyl-CoA dehydrogenase family protein, partial [Salmonella enterica]|uniref:acyl-CoA dehydrogenase family protein n=1 Tax=Salmonella enterica TaxID=28901 RepID=UPI003CF460E7